MRSFPDAEDKNEETKEELMQCTVWLASVAATVIFLPLLLLDLVAATVIFCRAL